MSLLSRLAVQAARAYGILSSKAGVSAEYLVVAGGGSGGGAVGGGGGAGGLLTSSVSLSTLNTYSITVGAGGASVSGSTVGNNGSNSVISGTGLSTITATGGGYGGNGNYSPYVGANGGSGGGGGGFTGTNSGGTGTSGQGNNGGIGYGGTSASYTGGGGGGASAAGSNGGVSNYTGGNGGNGTASSISGSSVTYAGGGGGCGLKDSSGAPSPVGGTGGSGGGGNGAADPRYSSATAATSATVNTGGGGGGGAYYSNGASGSGGSGIVIISYTSATPKFVGGTITTSGGKQIHTFTSSGTLSPITPITASYLVVAGGGSGGSRIGGGGGAGGLLTSSTTLYSGATYVVTVGAGGASVTSTPGTNGNQGSSSSLSGTGLTTITATGGGYGGAYITSTGQNGGNGGSGGGAAGFNGGLTGGSGTSGQGFAGGNAVSSGEAGGGGGGSSAVGSNGGSGSGGVGGAGGAGTASSITGTSVTYAGGGGGSGTGGGGAGGSGGGGAGSASTTNATPGTANTGGGGGGARNTIDVGGVVSGSGGSGIVIISYAGSQVFNGGLVTSSGGNTIHTFTSTGALTPLTNNLNNSLRFRSSASANLSRTPSVASNRKTWTWSAWVKRGTLGTNGWVLGAGAGGSEYTGLFFNSSNQLQFSVVTSSTQRITVTSSAVFRDPSAWYHITLAVDTNQATNANGVKIYVNGNQQALSFSTYTQSVDTAVNNTVTQNIGQVISVENFDGYMTDVYLIDGQALEPYYFGNNDANGVWKPIQYKGTYGTNGFYLTFGNTTSTTTLGYDSSPNGNNWTCNNISLTAGTTYDAMTDVPTNTSATVANYAVMNPLQRTAGGAAPTSANLKWAAGIADWYTCFATIGVSSGKYYWEVTNTNLTSSSTYTTIGISKAVTVNAAGTNIGSDADSYVYYSQNGNKINNGSQVAYGNSYVSNDIVGVALDLDNGKLFFSKNGTWQASGDPAAGTNAAYTGLSGTFQPAISELNSTIDINFGQRPFSYTPPTGFVALNTYNLPTPTILQGNKYMDANLWTGNGASTRVFNGWNFRPDFVWMKARNTTHEHALIDSNRGTGSKVLNSNSTAAEWGAGLIVSSFDANGFTGTTGTSNFTWANANNDTYVGWGWNAGSGSTSSNTSGSITSTVSVNTTAGFSVVTYTGTGSTKTFGHGLGVTPAMFIIKSRSQTGENWVTWHKSFSNTAQGNIALNTTDAVSNSASVWGNTAPTSTLITVGNSAVNNNTSTYVCYAWAEIAGFSKAFSYTGNGSTDGSFVYLGFRPKFILLKGISTAEDWYIHDSTRNTYNIVDLRLSPNLSSAEVQSTVTVLDFLSNGFKLRTSNGGWNGSGNTYIGIAFAEHPFKNSNSR